MVPAAKLPDDRATWMVSLRAGVAGRDRVAVLVLDRHADRHGAAGGDGAGRLGGDDQLVLAGGVDRERVGGGARSRCPWVVSVAVMV